MYWTALATADDSHAALEKTLWDVANQLWCNAALKPSEYSPTVLGKVRSIRSNDLTVVSSKNGGGEVPNPYEDLQVSAGRFDFLLANPLFNYSDASLRGSASLQNLADFILHLAPAEMADLVLSNGRMSSNLN